MFGSFGYDIHKGSPKNPFHDQQILLSYDEVSTIFDLGAHIGETVARYRPFFPKSTFYCFEPFPESFEKLRNQFVGDSLVKPIQMGVSHTIGTREFYVNQRDGTNSLFPRPKSSRRYYSKDDKTIDRIEIQVTTIDDFCRKESISEIQVFKMDIQGGELLALKGATEKLERGSIALIYSEVSFIPHYEGGAMFYEICNFLANYNYSLFDVYNHMYAKNGQLRFADAIFVSPRIRKDIIDSFEPEP